MFPLRWRRRIAMRLKGGLRRSSSPAVGPSAASAARWPNRTRPASPPGGMGAGENGAGARSGGAPDFQRMLSRLPAASLAELHKGDAVIVVSTEGTASGSATAITLVQRRRAHSASRAQRRPGHDACALEPGRSLRRRWGSIVCSTRKPVLHQRYIPKLCHENGMME